jgi:hypothetical protein
MTKPIAVLLNGEPPCSYKVVSESTSSSGTATTWARGGDGYWYRCVQTRHGPRVWTRFPPESKAAASTILRRVSRRSVDTSA